MGGSGRFAGCSTRQIDLRFAEGRGGSRQSLVVLPRACELLSAKVTFCRELIFEHLAKEPSTRHGDFSLPTAVMVLGRGLFAEEQLSAQPSPRTFVQSYSSSSDSTVPKFYFEKIC